MLKEKYVLDVFVFIPSVYYAETLTKSMSANGQFGTRKIKKSMADY